ncbi:hypothetical protein WDW86_22275 [Bdellovibrionota bacterium FG-2]
MTKQFETRRIRRALKDRLVFIATICDLSHGGQHHPKLSSGWRPILWFSKGEYEGHKKISDLVKPNKSLAGTAQEQVIAELICTRFCAEGETVLDPFLTNGDIAAVAFRSRMQFVGISADQQAIEAAKRQIGAPSVS